ncbi:MAG: hypothetical protein ACJ77K_06685 [Bacteroidia bacterium]
MKKILHLFIPAGLLLWIFAFEGCSGSSKKEEEKERSFTLTVDSILHYYNEDTIDLSKHPITQDTANSQKNAFQNSFLADSIYRLNSIIDTISYTDFKLLRDSAQAIISGSGHHVLGLRFIYGYDIAHRKISILYQPVYLKNIDYPKKSNAHYQPYAHSTLYKYQSGASHRFVVATSTDTACIAAYKDHIWCLHHGKANFERFISKNDSTGNVRSIVFSFQEIDAEIIDNGAKTIILHNAGENVFKNTNKKHVLILGCETLKGVILFYRKFGNLSHLCPPGCSDSYFDLK